MPKKFREDVEIISSASGQSWLKLINLPSGTPQTTYNGLLWLDASGNVIKIDASTIATVTVWPTAPSAPVTGQQWLDTSLSPSELKVYNWTSWELAGDEVQHYANFASFPATGDEDVLYVDDAADIVYVWDSTTSSYVNASWTGAGLFTITDGTTSQSIGVGNTISILDTNLIKAEVSATDTLTIGIDTTWATTGQVPSYNGTNVVWSTPSSSNIYTADGTIATDRVVTLSADWSKQLHFAPITWSSATQNDLISFWFDTSAAEKNRIEMINDQQVQFRIGTNVDSATMSGTDLTIDFSSVIIDSWSSIQLNATNWNYSLVTSPTNATTQTQALVRDASTGRLYIRDLATLSTTRYANTWTPTANVETVHTHALSAWEDIQIQVRDATTKEIVDVEIRIISATTFGVTSTTTAQLRVIAL